MAPPLSSEPKHDHLHLHCITQKQHKLLHRKSFIQGEEWHHCLLDMHWLNFSSQLGLPPLGIFLATIVGLNWSSIPPTRTWRSLHSYTLDEWVTYIAELATMGGIAWCSSDLSHKACNMAISPTILMSSPRIKSVDGIDAKNLSWMVE
jgi:hypothetical protein